MLNAPRGEQDPVRMGLSSCGVIRRGSGLCVLEHLKNGRWTPGD